MLVGFAALVALGTGCSQSCPTVVYPAVQAEVHDSVTNAPAAEGARGAIERAGTFVDSLRVQGSTTMIGWGNAPATYRVTVVKAGYRDWVRDGVLVTRSGGVCPAVNTVVLQVRLAPLP